MIKLPRYVKQGDRPLCFNACIASILDLDIDDVPFLFGYDKHDWLGLQKWLGDKYNLQILAFNLSAKSLYPVQYYLPCIVSGPSYLHTPEKPTCHARVAYVNSNKIEFIHDPHDENKFIPSIETIYFFVPIMKGCNAA